MKHVVIEKTHPNHLLHLVLTMCTGGLWLLIWPLISISYASKRKRLVREDADPAITKPSLFATTVVSLIFINLVLFGFVMEGKKQQSQTKAKPDYTEQQRHKVRQEIDAMSPGQRAELKYRTDAENFSHVLGSFGCRHC